MKYIFLFLITFLTTCNSYAHKDKNILKTYGNVKVFIKTGFEYSEIDKTKVIGILSEKIAENLKFKDTLMIEYIHDYTNNFKDNLYILENNNSNFKLIKGISETSKIESNHNGLAVRIYANEINILETLKLVEYSIKNRTQLNSRLETQKIQTSENYDRKVFTYEVLGNSNKFIESITSNKSVLIEKLIKKKIPIKTKKNYGIEMYWKNDEFIFEYKHLNRLSEHLFSIPNYYYLIPIKSDRLLIFVNKNDFYYLDINKSQTSSIKYGTYFPVFVIDKFKNKLLIYNSHENLSMYLIDKNKMIDKFE